ncbi:hypothetical protein EV359DRAFT_87992 [Lentinula novae-zelandiae]|nr:hypothetical protein EV359DRAFT_87992 [Lentinula novae-zelandiae]
MHFVMMVKLFGPVYAWWLFAFEHFNGILEKVKTNGHDGGRCELTMLRNWVQTHLLYEYLLALPADASEYKRNLVDHIIRAEASKARGSIMTEIAIFRSEVSNDHISLPKRISKSTINLHSLNYHALGANGEDVYTLILCYCQQIWPELELRRELSLLAGTSFIGGRVARRITHIRKDERNSLRVPVHIEDLFVIHIPDTDTPSHVCAVVRQLRQDELVPVMLWDLYATVLGIHTSFANDFGPLEVIPAADIDCPLALIPVPHFTSQRELWISVSFDHASVEPEEEYDDEGIE